MKKHIITLDLDDEEPLSDVAHLLFRSSQPGYLFADALNRLYGYGLHRIDDIALDGAQWPLYTHADGVDHLRYDLVEKPADESLRGAWGDHNKLLVIKGETALDAAGQILEDLTDPLPAAEGDLLALNHAAMRDELLADFLLVERFDPSEPLPPKTSRRATQINATLQRHTATILTHIDEQRLDIL